MKVGSSSSVNGSRKARGPKQADAGFQLPGGDDAQASTPATAVAGATGVTPVSTILALQDATSEEARPLAMRKGRRLLDALDRLQVALLGQGPNKAHLSLLKRALGEDRPPSGDQGLDEVLSWAEVRAAVEIAKLERGEDPA